MSLKDPFCLPLKLDLSELKSQKQQQQLTLYYVWSWDGLHGLRWLPAKWLARQLVPLGLQIPFALGADLSRPDGLEIEILDPWSSAPSFYVTGHTKYLRLRPSIQLFLRLFCLCLHECGSSVMIHFFNADCAQPSSSNTLKAVQFCCLFP